MFIYHYAKIQSLTLGFQYSDNPTLARRYLLQSLTYMAADGLISQDDLNEVKSQLKELNQEKLEKNQSSIIKDSFILDEDIGVEDQTQLAQAVSEPTRFSKPLETENVNPNLLVQAPTGIQTLASGGNKPYSQMTNAEKLQYDRMVRGLA